MKNWLAWGLGGGGVLLAAVVAWQLTGATYKTDVAAMCNGEKRSGTTFEKDHRALSTWIGQHVATPEGNALYTDLANLGLAARAERLSAEAKKVGVSPCPLADTYKAAQSQSDYRSDLSQLCTGPDGTSIEFISNDERLAKIKKWAAARPRSAKTTAFLEKLYAAPPADRPAMLSAEARANTVFSCGYADALARPPVPPGPGGPHVKPGPALIQGNLQQTAWASALETVLPLVKDCYDAEMVKVRAADAGNAQGHLTVRVEIDPAGHTGRAQVGPVEQSEIDACVQRAFTDKPFPAAKGFKALVLQPIDFLP